MPFLFSSQIDKDACLPLADGFQSSVALQSPTCSRELHGKLRAGMKSVPQLVLRISNEAVDKVWGRNASGSRVGMTMIWERTVNKRQRPHDSLRCHPAWALFYFTRVRDILICMSSSFFLSRSPHSFLEFFFSSTACLPALKYQPTLSSNYPIVSRWGMMVRDADQLFFCDHQALLAQ